MPEGARVAARSAVLLGGVLLLGAAFIASYVGALHNPRPRDLKVAVVRDDGDARAMLDGVRVGSDVLEAVEYGSHEAAATALTKRNVYAILSTDDSGAILTVAPGAGYQAAKVITDTLTNASHESGIGLNVREVAPLTAGDQTGLSAFYLVVGLVVGGYLAGAALAVLVGTVPRTFERAGLRLGGLAGFSVLAGLAGAVVTGSWLHIWSGHFLGLWAGGTLIAFAAGVVTAALGGWLGTAGIGVAILMLVVFGNPGSGGPYPPEFLPGAYRTMHNWLPPGLGVDMVRGIVYFGGRGNGWEITALCLYALAGVAGLLLATAVLGRRAGPPRTLPSPGPSHLAAG